MHHNYNNYLYFNISYVLKMCSMAILKLTPQATSLFYDSNPSILCQPEKKKKKTYQNNINIGFDQRPTWVWYAPVLPIFLFVSPTITVGLWSRPQSILARLTHSHDQKQ